jgi:hypothetical protein
VLHIVLSFYISYYLKVIFRDIVDHRVPRSLAFILNGQRPSARTNASLQERIDYDNVIYCDMLYNLENSTSH